MMLVSIPVPFCHLKCFFVHSIAALFFHSSSLTVKLKMSGVRCVKSLVLYCLKCSQNTDFNFF